MEREMSRRRLLASLGATASLGAVATGAGGALDGAAEGRDPAAAARLAFGWERAYDDAEQDRLAAVDRLSGGGYVAAGQSQTSGGTTRPWVVTIDATGELRWARTYTVEGEAQFRDVVALFGGGLLLVGVQTPPDGMPVGFVLRTDADGNEQWRRTIPADSGARFLTGGVETSDFEFAVAGYTSAGGSIDGWVGRLGESGDTLWTRSLTLGASTVPLSLFETVEDDLLVVGATEPADSGGRLEGLLLSLSPGGETLWSQDYVHTSPEGTHQSNVFYDVAETASGYLTVGFTELTTGGDSPNGWAVTTDETGTPQSNALVSDGTDTNSTLVSVGRVAGEYALVGQQRPASDTGNFSAWVTGVDPSLSRQWTVRRQFGGSSPVGDSVPTNDGGLVVVGRTTSDGGASSDGYAMSFDESDVTPTPTPSPTPTATPTATRSPTESPTATPTATRSPTDTVAPPTETTAPPTTTVGTRPPTATEPPTTGGGGDGGDDSGLPLALIGGGAAVGALAIGGGAWYLLGDDDPPGDSGSAPSDPGSGEAPAAAAGSSQSESDDRGPEPTTGLSGPDEGSPAVGTDTSDSAGYGGPDTPPSPGPDDTEPGRGPTDGVGPSEAHGGAPPGDAPPGDTQPGDAPPGDAPPGDTPPGDAPPGDTPPGGTGATDTGPAGSGPVDTDPGGAGPADPEHGTDEPVDSGLGGQRSPAEPDPGRPGRSEGVPDEPGPDDRTGSADVPPDETPVDGPPGETPPERAPGETPPEGAPGETPPEGAPGETPPEGAPGETPADEGASADRPAADPGPDEDIPDRRPSRPSSDEGDAAVGALALGPAADRFGEDCEAVRTATGIADWGPVQVYAAASLDGRPQHVMAIAPKHADDAETAAAFKSRARVWADLGDQPGVAEVYDAGTEPWPWVAYAPGDRSLAEAVDALNWDARVRLLDDIAAGLRSASYADVAHGTLSPETVRVDAGDGRLIDWGTSRAAEVASDETYVTVYTAPEQIESPKSLGPATDVYRFGALAYRVLVGQDPLPPTGDAETHILNGNIVHPQDVADLRPAVADALLGALARDPVDRYETPDAFYDALDRALGGQQQY